MEAVSYTNHLGAPKRMHNQYGLRNFWVLSSGGHEWANWRRYLHQTAQIMFPDCDCLRWWRSLAPTIKACAVCGVVSRKKVSPQQD